MKFLSKIVLRWLLFKSIAILLFLSYTSSFSQSFEFKNQNDVEQIINIIDDLIDENKFHQALIEIERLEDNPEFITVEVNKLNLDILKAETLYGLEREKEATDILLENFTLSSLIDYPDLYNEYAKFLGKVFFSSMNYDRAIYYYKSGLKFSETIKDSLNEVDFNVLIAKAFFQKKEKDSARFYYEKAVKYRINKENKSLISLAMSGLSGIAVLQDNYDLARKYGESSLEIEEQLGDTIGRARALFNLSGIYYRKGEFEIAEEFYKESLFSVKNMNNLDAIQIRENALYNLSYVNEELKDFESAYFYLLDATELSDSISDANIAQNISEIEAKYNFEKQARITEEEKRKRSQAQALFYGTALAFIAILALGYIFYRNYRLKQQNKLDQLENQTQTKIINATIDAKEKERKAIAETLHDSVSALLSSANLHLQATKAQLKQKSPQEITKAQTIVNEASVKIRDLSHELISSVLLKFGLAFAVHDMCQKYSNSEISLHSDDDGIKRYHQDFEIKIHNIIEELINNILKHSKAANATVMLAHKENDMLSVRISDDGVGFNPKSVRGKDGLGLSHIEARIKVMKGVFNIISSKDEGTNIFILVPIQFKEQSA